MKLNHRIAVYVPSTFAGNKPARMMQRRETKRAARYLCNLFGGCTQTRAAGYWMSTEKGLIKEGQNIIYSACTEESKKAHTAKVIAYAKRLARRMQQEAVTVEIDGVLNFIEA